MGPDAKLQVEVPVGAVRAIREGSPMQKELSRAAVEQLLLEELKKVDPEEEPDR